MRNIKLIIEYDGTNFLGWQIQGKKERTVQGEIEKALQKILKHKIRLIGSGRTDAGVHALAQTANFHTEQSISTNILLKALNANLPDDISIRQVDDVNLKFHSQYSVKTKTYRYTVLNRPSRSALSKNFSLHVSRPLNISAMRREIKSLIGKKDFKSFASSSTEGEERGFKNTIRHIKSATIKRDKDFITIDITANGFLYRMVRNIVGTLIEVGLNRVSKGHVQKILQKKDRKFASAPAKACGLCLLEVRY